MYSKAIHLKGLQQVWNRFRFYPLVCLFSSVIIVFVVNHSLAQKKEANSQWTVKDFGPDQGLEYKKVSSFVVDKVGIAWVGNEQGLKIFDGKKLYPASSYLKSSAETLELPVQSIIYDSVLNRLFVFAIKSSTTLLYSLHFDKINTENNALKELALIFGTLNDQPVYYKNKIILTSADRAIIMIFDQDKLIKALRNDKPFSRRLFAAGDGQFYFENVKENKLYRAEITDDSLHLIEVENLSLGAHQELFQSKGKFTSSKGVSYQNNKLQKHLLHARFAQEFGLPKEYYADASYAQDAHGNHYVYGPFGLQKVSRRMVFIKGVPTPNETRKIIYNSIQDVFYVGTSKGICLVDRKSKAVTEIASGTKLQNYYCCGQTIEDSLVVFTGIYPICKLLFLNKKNNQYWSKPSQTNLKIWKIYKQGKSTYYCTDSGLYSGIYTKGHFTFQKIEIGIKDELYDILALNNNEFLLAGKLGLYQYKVSKKASPLIMAGEFLCLDKLKNYILAGTAKKGLMIFDRKMILHKTINKGNALKSNIVFSMVIDESLNAVWIGSAAGLTLYHLPTGIHKTYTTVDGLLHNELNRNSTYKFKGDSLLIMGGIVGLNFIQNKLPLLASGQEVPYPAAWAVEAVYSNQKNEKNLIAIYRPDVLKLQSRVNKITLKIAQQNTELLFATAYKLDNEKNWKYVVAGEDIEILSPKNGNHDIELKTVLADGRESKIFKIPIEIELEWHMKPWGIIFLGFSFFMLLFPILYVRDYFQKQKNEKLINKNKEKLFTIIAHDLRSPITTYQNLAELINYLIEKQDWDSIKTVSESIDATGQKLDLLLENLLNWSLLEQKELKPILQLSNISSVSRSLIELYQFVAEKKSVKLNYSIEEDLLIQTDVNLFSLIFRNLLDNAVKNAENHSIIDISIGLNNKNLVVAISNHINIDNHVAAENMIRNIKSPDKSDGRGIGMRFIAQALDLLKGDIKAKLHETENKITIIISFPF